MQHARKRLIITAALLALPIIVSPAEAGWGDAEIGQFINMERVCRDGALVSIITQSDGSADATRQWERGGRYLAAAPEPENPLVTTRRGRSATMARISWPPRKYATLRSHLNRWCVRPMSYRGNGMPDIVQKYGISVLPWLHASAARNTGDPGVPAR